MYRCLELRADTLQLTRLSFAEYKYMHVVLKNYIIVGGIVVAEVALEKLHRRFWRRDGSRGTHTGNAVGSGRAGWFLVPLVDLIFHVMCMHA